MSHTSKIKGSNFEREIVEKSKIEGLDARRAWGSNGASIGLPPTVDVEISGCRAQLKIRKEIPKIFAIPDGADVTVFRENRGTTFVLLKWNDFMRMLKKAGW